MMTMARVMETLHILSKVIEISEEKKKEMLVKYSLMSDKEIIKDLSQTAYRILGDDPILYDYTLMVIRNINPEICPPVAKMKEILNKMFTNEVEGNMSLEEIIN